MTRKINGIKDVLDSYDVVLCDVWGVLHNGVDAFPHAYEALMGARESGTTVVLITNSPRLGTGVIEQLRGFGIPDGAYDSIVTSGDVTQSMVETGPKKVYPIGLDRDMALLDGLQIVKVSPDEADVIVCTGLFDDQTETAEDYRETLTKLAVRDIPFICANPDLIVESGHRLLPCAGALAALYEQLGGSVQIAGKPHSHIYKRALALARHARGPFDPGRVLAVGDGLPTDVRGAIGNGLDLLYISGGIHAVHYSTDGVVDEQAMIAWLDSENVMPLYWMTRLH